MSVVFLLFLSFLCFIPKMEKIRGVNNFFDVIEVAAVRSHVRIRLE